ncbi:ER to Golgi transport-related protein, putative [Cryptococcus deneoformans JEC21]|uniref:ER to Golgi transport-related protein, putative n=2 Tax=Cryptococcus deneoformans TaxID=40410 RepID=Q5KAA6_CRYD1|nr:ER to Golgi transport-related protein, putative [Cryptococcus neoformans var. neoformans JEC21]AAW45920.2 ER to Golgi transport-related protein, putative [Cryptococcus neoformans var. neoformans JEC21]
MVAHMSLDSVEEVIEGTGALYLKGVDRHNEWTVSAFIPTGVKFILLHDVKNDDGIRLFFIDLWEAYVKILLNPFFTTNTPIKSPAFEARVKSIAKRHL